MNSKKRKNIFFVSILTLVLIGIFLTVFIVNCTQKPLLTLLIYGYVEKDAPYRFVLDVDGTLTSFERNARSYIASGIINPFAPRYSETGKVMLSETEVQGLMVFADELPSEAVSRNEFIMTSMGGIHVSISYDSKVYVSEYYVLAMRDQLVYLEYAPKKLTMLVDEILRLSPTSIDLLYTMP